MNFRTWAALAVAVLVVAPFIAHLLRRRPPEEQRFAATKLVPATPAVANRRRAIEDRALFALRALAVLALAVLGATPLIRCSRLSLARQSGASVALAIVLDDSLSMRAAPREGGASRFARAVLGARQLLGSMQEGDSVAIVMAGKPVRVLLGATTNLAAAHSALERARDSDRGTDLDGAVRVASELIRGLQHVDKRIVVLSDLNDEQGARLLAPEGVKLWAPLAELRGPIDDCAVVHGDRNGSRVTVRVACSNKPVGRRVSIVAGQDVLAEAPLVVEGHASDMAFPLADATVEKHATTQLYAQLSGHDAIAADDSAPIVVSLGQLRVGVVSDPASDRIPTGGPPLIEQAFRALDLAAQVTPMTTVPDRTDELDQLALLLVDDPIGFTPAQRRELAAWLERGRVMLLTLGPRAASAPLGSGFAPMLPGLVRWRRTAARGLDPKEGALFIDAGDGLDDLAPSGRAKLELSSAKDAGHAELTTLARWDDGEPFLLQRRLGRGLAFTVTLPFSSEQSDFALRPAFFALLEHLVGTSRAIGGVARATVGSGWPLAGYRDIAARHLDRFDQATPQPIDTSSGGQHLVSAWLGLYELTLDGSKTYRVAAIDERELAHVPCELAAAHDTETLGTTLAQVDVSPQVALVLLALLALEIAIRVVGRWLERRA